MGGGYAQGWWTPWGFRFDIAPNRGKTGNDESSSTPEPIHLLRRANGNIPLHYDGGLREDNNKLNVIL
jgi:hypothetical protein